MNSLALFLAIVSFFMFVTSAVARSKTDSKKETSLAGYYNFSIALGLLATIIGGFLVYQSVKKPIAINANLQAKINATKLGTLSE